MLAYRQFADSQCDAVIEILIGHLPLNGFFIEDYISDWWGELIDIAFPDLPEERYKVQASMMSGMPEFTLEFKNYLFAKGVAEKDREDLIRLTELGKKLKKYKTWTKLKRREDLEERAWENDNWRSRHWLLLSVLGFVFGIVSGVFIGVKIEQLKDQSPPKAKSGISYMKQKTEASK